MPWCCTALTIDSMSAAQAVCWRIRGFARMAWNHMGSTVRNLYRPQAHEGLSKFTCTWCSKCSSFGVSEDDIKWHYMQADPSASQVLHFSQLAPYMHCPNASFPVMV